MTHISSTDVVPVFLPRDFALNKVPSVLGDDLVEVISLDNGQAVTLRGFEYSLARMLDGRRTAQQVLSNAAQVGLKLTMQDLDGFAKKLAQHGLVGAKHSWHDISPWMKRTRWSENTRELYQLALRRARAGKLQAARGALDTLLREAPSTAEAIRLRACVVNGLRSPEGATEFQRLFDLTEKEWLEHVEADVDLTAETIVPPRHAWLAPLLPAVAITALIAVGLAALVVPLPRQVTSEATVGPQFAATLAAPRDGLIDTVEVLDGQWVEPGSVVFTYDSTQARAQLTAARAQAFALEAALLAQLPTTAPIKKLRALVADSIDDLERAQAHRDVVNIAGSGLANSEPSPRDWVVMAEFAVDQAQARLDDAREQIEAQLPDARLAELATLRARVQSLQTAALTDLAVTAPRAGFVNLGAAVRPRALVHAGDALAVVEDTHTLKASATVSRSEARALQPDLPATLLLGGHHLEGQVLDVEGLVVTARFDNQQFALPAGEGMLSIKAVPRPLLTSW